MYWLNSGKGTKRQALESEPVIPAAVSDRDTAHVSTPALHSRGSSQGGMRQYNERVVLNSLRVYGSLPKAELARMTGLTAQTIGTISARLEEEGLIVRQQPVRGRIGQPSVPLGLNPQGAYAIGIKVGRRRTDCLCIDFLGKIQNHLMHEYDFPRVDSLIPLLHENIETLCQGLGAKRRRLAGIGIAAPFQMDGWQRLLGLDAMYIQGWGEVDLSLELQQRHQLPVYFVRDTSAACVAELVNGKGRNFKHFLYIFVDTFVGGGLVLNNLPYFGLHGNAGAIGSLPLALSKTRQKPLQLLAKASLWELELVFKQHGLAPQAAYDVRSLQHNYAQHTQIWLQEAALALAQSIASGTAFLDITHVVLDGSFSPQLRQALLEQTQQALAHYNWEGLWQPTVHLGSIGAEAIAYGGALLPLHEQFAPDAELFLKVL